MNRRLNNSILTGTLALGLLFQVMLTPSAHAWGPTGHRVVAEIAQRHLTPAAQAKVSRLLGGRSLADVANWPDELRSDARFDKYKPLHFATVPNGVASYRDSKKAPCGDLVVAIDALTAFLRTGSREALYSVKALSDKSDGTAEGSCNPRETDPISPDTALRFLVHLMGDLHQPLHIGGADQGGNAVSVNWMDRWKTNLHSTWDDEMVDFERLDYTEYARFLDRASEADAARWLTGDTISYADEAIAMRSKLYLFPDDSGTAPSGKVPVHKISYKYIGAQRDRMREQLLKGGLRLARVLNAIFQ
ncbi:MAG TPA: S1/P1 nuclease [Blastocatellia bacterium]|nr:S1/P1 nuclease [Blastocatellia bacterium]